MADIFFKRKIYDRMLRWKEESSGDTALLIKGARRVGKSTVAEQFAQNEYERYILIDFAKASAEVKALFDDISDLDYFFLQLQIFTGVQLIERKSLIIFDEVQMLPAARQAIKHLVKDGRYDYLETGSLLSIKKNTKDIVIPSEETKITMFPMDYEEFRWTLGDNVTSSLIAKALKERKALGDGVNRKLMRDFRLYMLIGGMPQAVATYLETNNFSKVDSKKREIIELYEEDFKGFDSTGRASRIFSAIPAELSKNAARYQISSVDAHSRVNRVAETIEDLLDSMTVNIAFHADDPNVGMALTKDLDRYKLFLADTGLFVTLAFKDKDFTENIIYERILADKLPANMGYVYENAVAQILRTSGNELYYYTMPSETSNRNYEIDFLLSRGGKICPIEVKSSGYKTHKSLDVFCEKFSRRIGEKYLVYTKDLRFENGITMLPVYMLPFLD
ncbi:MAG: AAA family ATPase [Bacillota bacterium]|nr:AAA family ATPase [Bacillota bacterium]